MNLWKYKGYANSIYHKIQSFRIIIQSFSSTLLLDLLLLRYRLTFVLSSKKFGRFSRWSGLSDWKWLRSFVSKIFFLFSSSTSLCTFGIVTFLYASGELSISLCSYFERCLMCLKIINTEWGWKQYHYIYLNVILDSKYVSKNGNDDICTYLQPPNENPEFLLGI